MMNVDELEAKIADEKAKLALLEDRYAAEKDEHKATKLEYSISRKDEVIERLIDRQQTLLDREIKDGEKEDLNDKDAEEDDTVCPECGSDLFEVEEGVLFCEKCKDYYTEIEGEEEDE